MMFFLKSMRRKAAAFIINKYKSVKQNIINFIYKLRYYSDIGKNKEEVERPIWTKSESIVKKVFDICFTGALLYYTLTNFNWISCGLAAWFATYYIEWFVKIIKRKEEM